MISRSPKAVRSPCSGMMRTAFYLPLKKPLHATIRGGWQSLFVKDAILSEITLTERPTLATICESAQNYSAVNGGDNG